MSVKVTTKCTYRRRTLTQNALFLQHVASINIDYYQPSRDVQEQFDTFYATALRLLDQFYPQHAIMTTSHYPTMSALKLKHF